MNSRDNGENVMWEPIEINAAVYGTDFTDSNVELFYYEDPDY